MARYVSRVSLGARDDHLHLLLAQIGVQAFAEFAEQHIDDGLHGGMTLGVDGALLRAIRFNPAAQPLGSGR